MKKLIAIFLIFVAGGFLSAAEKGDVIFTGGWFGLPYKAIGDLPLGHVGMFAGTVEENGKIKAVIIDCVPDYFKPGGIRKVSWKQFTHNFSYPYYGNRTTPKKPTLQQREDMVKIAESMLKPKAYSFSHNSQKGPDKFDCVGFVEYLYEKVKLNITPDDQESGWGWPLTPSEQFYATVSNTGSAAQMSYVSLIKAKPVSEIHSLEGIKSAQNQNIDLPTPDFSAE